MAITDIQGFIKEARSSGYSNEEINERLKKQGSFVPELQEQMDFGPKGFLGGAGTVTGSTELGTFLGTRMASGSTGRMMDQKTQEMQTTMDRLEQKINQGKRIGKDTSRLEKAKRDLAYEMSSLENQGQQIATGNVTGKQAIGSAIRTVGSAIPLGSLLSKVGTAAKLTKAGTAGINTIGAGTKAGRALGAAGSGLKSAIKLGAVGGAIEGLGYGIQEKDSIGGVVGSTALGTGLGAVGGAALFGVGKLLGKVTPGLNELAPRITKTILPKYREKIARGVNEAIGLEGLTQKQALRSTYGGAEGIVSPRMRWVDMMSDFKTNVLKEGKFFSKTGTKTVEFDPKKAKMGEYFQAGANKVREIFDEWTFKLDATDKAIVSNPKIAIRAKGIFEKVADDVRNFADEQVSQKYKNYILENTKEISNLKTVKQLNKYVNDILSEDITTSGLIKQDTKAKIALQLKNILMDGIEQVGDLIPEGKSLRALKADSEAMKSVQDALFSGMKKEAASALIEIDPYGSANVVAGTIFGSPAQIGKGASFGSIKTLTHLDAASKLNRAFIKNQSIIDLLSTTEGAAKINNVYNFMQDLPKEIQGKVTDVISKEGGKINTEMATILGLLGLGGGALGVELNKSENSVEDEEGPSK